MAQLALAWLLHQRDYVVPIPGSRSRKRVEDNIAGADLALTESDLAAIDSILPNGAFGARYADGQVPTWV